MVPDQHGYCEDLLWIEEEIVTKELQVSGQTAVVGEYTQKNKRL